MSDDIKEIPQESPAQNKPAESLKKKSFEATLWKILEVGSKHFIQVGISIVLARLIAPAQFGIIAMLTIFIAVANTFVDSGFTSALIKKNNRTQVDCCTVFYFNIVISIIAYVILFFAAPFVAKFYDMAQLCIVLRVTALSIVIGAFNSVQSTLFGAELNFKVLSKYNVLGFACSGVIGIVLAYFNFQVWALVAQQLTGSLLSTVFLWYKSTWRPTWTFSWVSFREFFGFGSKLLASSLLNTVFNNLYSVVIGKVFKAADLAFYTRAYSLNNLTSSTPTSVLISVTFPALSKIQDNDDRLRNGYRRMLKISAFVIFPMCLGIGAISYPLINIFYTAKWIYAASLLEIIVFAGMWYPIHAINLNLLMVKGRSDLFLKLEIIKKILTVIVLCVSVPFGIKVICYCSILSSLISLFINTYYTGKLLDLGFWKQLKDISHVLMLSLVMFVICKITTTILGNGWVSLGAGIGAGILIYGGGTLLFRFPELKELIHWRK